MNPLIDFYTHSWTDDHGEKREYQIKLQKVSIS